MREKETAGSCIAADWDSFGPVAGAGRGDNSFGLVFCQGSFSLFHFSSLAALVVGGIVRADTLTMLLRDSCFVN